MVKLEAGREDTYFFTTLDSLPELSWEFLERAELSFSRLRISANLCFCFYDGFFEECFTLRDKEESASSLD